MANEKFKIFTGEFICKTCNEKVGSLRLWLETAHATWICSQKHISKVNFIKTKKDYERENRE
jgi:hypothetical protein